MKEITGHRNISIWIDTYDDIFSDFDPRPYSERNISDDFIYELKRVVSESDFQINDFKLLIPEKARNREYEQVIGVRLHQFIKDNYKSVQQLKARAKRNGLFFTAFGATLILSAGYISFRSIDTFAYHILRVLFEPAGWFLMWTGLDGLIHSLRKHRPEAFFYQKLVKCKIQFIAIEQTKN